MSQLLQDRVALITGSSAGIGAGIAEVYAREGADVVVNYRSNADGAEATAQAVRKHGRRALWCGPTLDLGRRGRICSMKGRAISGALMCWSTMPG